MVSPLTIWQHPQPKYLWPVLGGLSVLAHVGVLGLSLPYMLTLMPSAGGTSASSTIPIELVSGEDTAQTTAEFSAAEANDEQSESGATEVASQAEVATEETTSLEPSSSSFESDESQQARNRSTMSEYNNSQTSSKPPLAPTTGSSEPSTGSSEPSTGSSEPSTGSSEPSTGSSEPSTGSSEPSTGSSEPSTGSSEPGLPLPGQGPGEVSLSIMGFQPPPEDQQHDPKPILPSLSPEAPTSIPLKPQDLSCEPVSFSNQPWTYRIAVDIDGSVYDVTPQNPEEPEAVAIACLIRGAGILFTPAQQDDSPVLDDNLILTVQVK
jgi:cobalamin biosynthesis Mg chelatase CobN